MFPKTTCTSATHDNRSNYTGYALGGYDFRSVAHLEVDTGSGGTSGNNVILGLQLSDKIRRSSQLFL